MGGGASIPFVPNRETGEMEEAHYIKESLGRSTVGRLCRELMKPDSKLERLIIEDCNLGVATGEALGLALANSENLGRLEITRTGFVLGKRADWGDLLGNVRSSPTITALRLEANQSSADARLALGNILSAESILTSLALRACNLDVTEVELLGLSIGGNRTLRTLDLSNNPCIGPEGVVLLARSLHAGESSITTLRLAGVRMCGIVRLGHKQRRQARAARKRRWPPPRLDPTMAPDPPPNLDVPDLHALAELCEAVKNNEGTLTALDVGDNWLGPTGVRLLMQVLGTDRVVPATGDNVDTSVTTLPIAVSGGMVGVGGAPVRQLRLRSLGLSRNRLCCDDTPSMQFAHDSRWRFNGGVLRELLDACSTDVTDLDISHNELQWEGAIAVADSLQRDHGSSITSLNLASNMLCGANKRHDLRGLEHLCRALCRKRLGDNEDDENEDQDEQVNDVSEKKPAIRAETLEKMRQQGLAPPEEDEMTVEQLAALEEAERLAKEQSVRAPPLPLPALNLTKLNLSNNFLKREGAALLASTALADPLCPLVDLCLHHNDINRGKVKKHAEGAGGVEAYARDNGGLREMLVAIEETRIIVKLGLQHHDAENSVRQYCEQEQAKLEYKYWLDFGVREVEFVQQVEEVQAVRHMTRE